MYSLRILLLLACLALCRGHAVLPLVPAVHSHYPLEAVPYPLLYHGYANHGLFAHGLLEKPVAHHLLKRSPHFVEPLAHVAHVPHIAPVAVSHQSRVDLHASPALLEPVPVVKPLVAPVVPVPVLHKTLLTSPLHYGAGLHGGLYPHIGHY